MMSGEAAAQQCRNGRCDTGYGFNVGYNSIAASPYNNGCRNYGSDYGYSRNLNNRYDLGYNSMLDRRGYSQQRPALFGRNDLRNDYPGAGYGYRNRGYDDRPRSGDLFGNPYVSNQRPAAFRHGNHIDVTDGISRIHLDRRGF